DRGWANLDVALALIVVMAMTVFGLTKYKDWQQEKNWQVEASHISTYAAAARGYVGRNYATLLSATSTTAPTVITTAMLKNTGFLPSGFTETNSQGQRLNTYLVRNGQNTELLQGMVVSSGGSVYPDKALRLISRDIKTGFGGYIDDGKTATGALRSWKILLSSYGATSGNGHIAVLLSTDELSGAQEDNDRLYRFQVNGRPDLNKMHTAIDMGGNNLNSVGTINGQTGTFSGNVSGSNGIFTSNVSGANGSFTQNITAGAQVKGATVRADSDISAGRNITATNEVSGATVKATGNLSAGGVLQLDRINVAGIACYPNGQISRDANGGILSCQSGAWTSSGKVSAFEMIQGNDACGKYVYSKAYCPAGKQLISGGWVLSNWTGGNGWNAPDSSMPSPSDNAWQLVTGGGVTGGTCMRAIAWCAKN
ncbi:TPA: shufflon system plasmid conjugative transfer pilus tip adhesin PilV, partial [Citrobacter freundii]|nr:shufflon system plasmid conjugative transfer pilus tip adhesin PilV [Citrobacter freundii]